MFLRSTQRWKDGKAHLYWSLVENRRVRGGRVVQQTVLYLGEINDSQKEQWIRAIEVFDEDGGGLRQLKLFAAEGGLPAAAPEGVQVCLRQFELHRPRQWGGCWLFTELWKELGLEEFWRTRLGFSREGTDWEHVLETLCCYRLLDPGSEWRLHRTWFERSAMADLLGEDFSLAAKDTLYRCLDRLLEHQRALFDHLSAKWKDLFGVNFEVLLYDLTSTYFESDPPTAEHSKRKFGYSRDKRPDCVQVVIALVITPEGFPLAYEVMPGHTSDKTTLRGFLHKIENQYGKAQRIWIMDRGIPTEEVLAEMRAADPPVHYLVGTPKGRLSKLEAELLARPWQEAREGVEVKLLPRTGEVYVLARSKDRVAKERAMRRRQLKKLWARLAQLARMAPPRDTLLLKLGAAKAQSPLAWRLVEVVVATDGALSYALRKDKLREVTRREGRYLLRSNLKAEDPAQLWRLYMLLAQVEEAFKNLKGDLAVRPIYHQLEHRIEAHIFIAFLAFCLHATLCHKLRLKAPGLSARSVLEQLSAIQMLDVHFPTTDGRTLIFSRYTMPDKLQKLLLAQLELELPEQAPPRITSKRSLDDFTQ
ncbi:MAG: IS1634 family transposase [Gemmatimonadales bacterium]